MSNSKECAWLINGGFCAIAVAIGRLGRHNVGHYPDLALEPTTNVCRPAYLGISTEAALMVGDQMLNGKADVNAVAELIGNLEIIPILNGLLEENATIQA